jgi:hypothetical protein
MGHEGAEPPRRSPQKPVECGMVEYARAGVRGAKGGHVVAGCAPMQERASGAKRAAAAGSGKEDASRAMH